MSHYEHKFEIHNYKKPTFCKHCNKLLVGIIKQGLRCKRCGVDIHVKCKDVFNQNCIEVLKGHHNFKETTYYQPTYCDYCTKLLVGITKQGLKCSECGANVHLKCEDKIEPMCEKTKLVGRTLIGTPKRRRKKFDKNKESDSDSDRQRNSVSKESTKQIKMDKNYNTLKNEENSSTADYKTESFMTVDETKPIIRTNPVFEKMPPKNSSAKNNDKKDQQKKMNVKNLNEEVDSVAGIVKNNIEQLKNRQEKLEDLETKAQEMEDHSNMFEKRTVELKKKYWWKNKKFLIAGVAMVVTLVAIIIIAIVIKSV